MKGFNIEQLNKHSKTIPYVCTEVTTLQVYMTSNFVTLYFDQFAATFLVIILTWKGYGGLGPISHSVTVNFVHFLDAEFDTNLECMVQNSSMYTKATLI